MDTFLYRPFVVSTPLIKAEGGASSDGPRIVSGPIKPDAEDYDGEILDDLAIEKGMVYHRNFGSHVDFAHMYARTKDLKWLVGRGEHIRGPEGKHWLKTLLQKGKEKADDIWRELHLDPPTQMGYSIQGILKARDQKDKRRIIDSEIHLITIDPQPKGFGNFLQIGVPVTSLGALTKALASELTEEHLPEPWQSTPISFDDSLALTAVMTRLTRLEAQVEKALTTGAGIVGEGATGGAALRGQAFAKEGNPEQPRCRQCGCKNKPTRKCCRKCGAQMAEKALDPLVESLRARGVPAPETVAVAVRRALA